MYSYEFPWVRGLPPEPSVLSPQVLPVPPIPPVPSVLSPQVLPVPPKHPVPLILPGVLEHENGINGFSPQTWCTLNTWYKYTPPSNLLIKRGEYKGVSFDEHRQMYKLVEDGTEVSTFRTEKEAVMASCMVSERSAQANLVMAINCNEPWAEELMRYVYPGYMVRSYGKNVDDLVRALEMKRPIT